MLYFLRTPPALNYQPPSKESLRPAIHPAAYTVTRAARLRAVMVVAVDPGAEFEFGVLDGVVFPRKLDSLFS